MTEPRTERVYTMADRPPDISEKLWKIAIDQGTVESSRGENILAYDLDLGLTEEESARFEAALAQMRATGK